MHTNQLIHTIQLQTKIMQTKISLKIQKQKGKLTYLILLQKNMMMSLKSKLRFLQRN